MARNTKDRTNPDLWTYRDTDSWGNADITAFDVEATDGSIGSVDEASFDAGSSYIVVDTGPWIFGKKVVLPAGVVQRVDVGDRRVWVDLTKSQIENAPEFDERRYRDEDYRTEIGGHYAGYTKTDRDYMGSQSESAETGAVIERSEERLTVDKDTQQVGSVRVGKRTAKTDTQHVTETVRREEFDVDEDVRRDR